jgi:glycosyltransferase involved in cell wall biosynthesis
MSANSTPKVTVIIPTFNYGKFVESAIESALHQDYPDIEIIVVDDGSTDDTQDRLSKRSDITYVRQSNRGLSATRNEGLRIAAGRYVQFLDADDLLDRDSIRKRVAVLEDCPDIPFAVCRTLRFSTLTGSRLFSSLQHEWHLPTPERLALDFLHFNIAPPHAFLTRSSVIKRHNMQFDTALKACEDYDFWIKLAAIEGLPAIVDSCYVRYRVHANSMSKSLANQFFHDSILCRRTYEIFEMSPKWIDQNRSTDYICAMLSSAVLTSRRLWHERPNEFQKFFDEHTLMVLSKLIQSSNAGPVSREAYFYLAKARAYLAKMCWEDGSIPETHLSSLMRATGDWRAGHYASYASTPNLYRQAARAAKFDAIFNLARVRRTASRGEG